MRGCLLEFSGVVLQNVTVTLESVLQSCTWGLRGGHFSHLGVNIGELKKYKLGYAFLCESWLTPKLPC
jgi:hypothetical protein